MIDKGPKSTEIYFCVYYTLKSMVQVHVFLVYRLMLMDIQLVEDFHQQHFS